MRTVAAVVALVLCVHAGLWALLQRQHAVANIDAPLASISYSPYARSQHPDYGDRPTPEQIRADLKLLSPYTQAIRTYRVANIHDVEVTGEPFTRPEGFDLPAHWEKTARAYEAGVYREETDIRLSPKGLSLLELLGPYVTEAAAETATAPDGQGWVRCTIPIESLGFGIRELMRLGEEVEVIGPKALREKMAATLAAMSRCYG